MCNFCKYIINTVFSLPEFQIKAVRTDRKLHTRVGQNFIQNKALSMEKIG